MRKNTSHRPTRAISRGAAALVLAAGAMLTAGVTGAQAAPDQDNRLHGCPLGAVCLYPRDAGFNNDRPSHAFFSYGAHNLRNQFGNHMIVNNQIGDAKARTCTGFNGTGDCQGFLPAGGIITKNLTPINSIRLVEPPPRGKD